MRRRRLPRPLVPRPRGTHILAWEGTEENPDQWYWFEGNFESYEKNKVERLGPEAAKPHRVVHRKLTR